MVAKLTPTKSRKAQKKQLPNPWRDTLASAGVSQAEISPAGVKSLKDALARMNRGEGMDGDTFEALVYEDFARAQSGK